VFIMQIEEFLRHVASEPERTVVQTIVTNGPELLAKLAKPGGVRLTDFLSAPGRRTEQRECRYRHILGGPASPRAIEAWQEQHPSHPLPADLQALVARINGIHLWAYPETGRSYTGLAPIEEWELARIKMYGPTVDRRILDDRYIALSYDLGGAAFVVLDPVSSEYFLMDTAGPDTSTPIGSTAGELLDWLWKSRIPPPDGDNAP
jgi:hypothetical protein